MISHRKDRMK